MAPIGVPQRVGHEFAELICADEQWLREEFDALITAGFGAPPARFGPPAPPTVPPDGRPWRYSTSGFPVRGPVGPLAGTAGSAIRRQRSPPPLTGPPSAVRRLA
ncbi:hypothetical protein ACQP1W_33405 [Spirillospora sp. CA-255316]